MTLSNTAIERDHGVQTKGIISNDARMELVIYCVVVIVMALIVTVSTDFKFAQAEDEAKTAVQNFRNFIASISEFVGVYLMLLLGLKAQS